MGTTSLVTTGICPFPTSAHPPADRPKPQCLRRSARALAAQRLSAFSTGLTPRSAAAKLGGCANGLRIACSAGPLRGRRHHSLVTPIDWKLGQPQLAVVVVVPRQPRAIEQNEVNRNAVACKGMPLAQHHARRHGNTTEKIRAFPILKCLLSCQHRITPSRLEAERRFAADQPFAQSGRIIPRCIAQITPRFGRHGAIHIMIPRHHKQGIPRNAQRCQGLIQKRTHFRILLRLPRLRQIQTRYRDCRPPQSFSDYRATTPRAPAPCATRPRRGLLCRYAGPRCAKCGGGASWAARE